MMLGLTIEKTIIIRALIGSLSGPTDSSRSRSISDLGFARAVPGSNKSNIEHVPRAAPTSRSGQMSIRVATTRAASSATL